MTDLERAREYEADRLWASVVKETGIWISPYAEQVADFGRLVIPKMREALAEARDGLAGAPFADAAEKGWRLMPSKCWRIVSAYIP